MNQNENINNQNNVNNSIQSNVPKDNNIPVQNSIQINNANTLNATQVQNNTIPSSNATSMQNNNVVANNTVSNVNVVTPNITSKQQPQQTVINNQTSNINQQTSNIVQSTNAEQISQQAYNSFNQETSTETSEKKEGNFKYIMTILLFVGLFVMVFFLPDISNYFSTIKKQKLLEQQELIISGTLNCKLTKNDDKFDYEYLNIFTFDGNKLKKLEYKTTIRGNKDDDKEELEENINRCEILKESTNVLDGITVSCGLNDGTLINNQTIRFKEIDEEKLSTAYLEAGGTYPNYKYDQDIDEIEKNMKASGFTCSRYK